MVINFKKMIVKKFKCHNFNILNVLFISLLFLTPFLVEAQQQPYNLLVGLPEIGTQTTLAAYIPAAFRLAIGASAVLAFVMITFGGIMYATSDAITGKEQGREYLTNAVVGLLLVVGAYAILWTINPRILNIDLNMPVPPLESLPMGVPGVGAPGVYTGARNPDGTLAGYTLTEAQVQQNTTLVNQLNSSPGRVEVNAGPCATGATQGCTNIVLLRSDVVPALKRLSTSCSSQVSGCQIVIVGGSEGGHRTHGPGMATVDLRPTSTLNTYLSRFNNRASNPTEGLRVNLPGGGVAEYEVTGSYGRSTGNHWHVQF